MTKNTKLATTVGALIVAGLAALGLYLAGGSVEVAEEPDAVENGVVDDAPAEE